jgi:hypothetical protein
MQPLLDSLSALKQEFAGESEILSAIDWEIELAQQWISDNTDEDPNESRPTRTFGHLDTSDRPGAQTRGIFDDVDD